MSKLQTQIFVSNGKDLLPIFNKKSSTFQAKAGENYSVVTMKDGKPQLTDQVIAKKIGNNLQVVLNDGSQVTLENFYIECKAPLGCDVLLPAKNNGQVKLGAAGAEGLPLGDGSSLVYSYGDKTTLMEMASTDTALRTALSQMPANEVSYDPSGGSGSPAVINAGSSFNGLLGGLLGLVGLGAIAGGGGGQAQRSR